LIQPYKEDYKILRKLVRKEDKLWLLN